ncbi:MAG: hypothetical protein ABEJ36_03905 [Candidatus Nanosalina sp.]
MSTDPAEVETGRYRKISRAAEELLEQYETRMLDLGYEIEAIGGEVVDEEFYADKTASLTRPENVSQDLQYLIPVSEQVDISLMDALKAMVQDPDLGGREKIGEQVIDSDHVEQEGDTVVRYFQDRGGWTAEISYIEDGEVQKPGDDQLQRFVSEVEHALDENGVETRVLNWDE